MFGARGAAGVGGGLAKTHQRRRRRRKQLISCLRCSTIRQRGREGDVSSFLLSRAKVAASSLGCRLASRAIFGGSLNGGELVLCFGLTLIEITVMNCVAGHLNRGPLGLGSGDRKGGNQHLALSQLSYAQLIHHGHDSIAVRSGVAIYLPHLRRNAERVHSSQLLVVVFSFSSLVEVLDGME
jgi:hypothetical protein